VKKTGSCDALVDFSDFLPTLAELAGARLPEGYALDGHSFAPLLAGKPFAGRPWVYSNLGTARWLRDRNWLLDGDGKLWYCGDNRDETKGYENKTASDSSDAAAARRRFAEILATIPAPDLNDPEVGAALRRYQQKALNPPQKKPHLDAAKKKSRSPNDN
jgi:arylsulfatase A